MTKIVLESLRYMSGSHIVFDIDWEAGVTHCRHIEKRFGKKATSHSLGNGSISECWPVILEFNAMGYREVYHGQPTFKAIVAGTLDAKEKTCWKRAPLTFDQWRELGYSPLLLTQYFEGFHAHVADVAVQAYVGDRRRARSV